MFSLYIPKRVPTSLSSISNPGPAADGRTFSGKAPAGATISITDGTTVASVTATVAGLWTYTFASAPTGNVTATATLTSTWIRPGGSAPPAVTGPLLGVYAANWGDAVHQYEGLIGRKVNYAESHSGRANASDYVGSIGYVLNLCDVTAPAQKRLAIPLFYEGGSLADAAAGSYDSMWSSAADSVLSNIPGQTTIVIRTAWEFNHDFQPWGIKDAGGGINATKAANYVTAWRKFVDIFRARATAANRTGVFKFNWCINIGDYDYSSAWPGDTYVDIVGVDMYHFPQYGQSTDPATAWTFMRQRPYGLDALLAFATTHGKPLSVPEWGVSTDGFGEGFIKPFYEWAAANNLESTAYWSSEDAYPSWLGTRANNLAWVQYMVNRANYPTPPVTPAYSLGSNLFATSDLTNGAWIFYGNAGGSVTRTSSTQVTFSADGDGKSLFTSQNTPTGKYIQEATITRTSGSGTFRIEYYGGSDGYYYFDLDTTKLPLNQKTKVEVLWTRNVDDSNHNFGFAAPGGIGALSLTIENQSLKPVTGNTSRWASSPVLTVV